ncbi:hypothetical protein GmRootA79_49720 [Acidovorax sp. A79]
MDPADRPGAGTIAAGGAATARDPVPAQGTSAQKRPWADKGTRGVGNSTAVMARPF